MNEDLFGVSPDVIIIGAGITGACLAYYLAQRGVKPLIVDRRGPAAEAPGANAGMVSPSSGIPGSSLALSVESAKLYERAEIELERPLQFHRNGKLLLAFTPAEVRNLETFQREREGLGLSMRLVSPDEIQEIEPLVTDKAIAGLRIEDDGHIDPMRATVAFLEAARQLGAEYRGGIRVDGILAGGGRVDGVVIDGHKIRAEQVVIAAGAWSAQLAKDVGVRLAVEPGRGQLLTTEPLPPVTSRVIRGTELGFRQLDSGRVLFGSAVEFVGYRRDIQPSRLAGFTQELIEIMPRLAHVHIQRVWAGLRPMTPDGLLLIGPAPGVDGLYVLTGHGTTGVGMGPASALALAELMTTGMPAIPLEPYALERFGA